MEVVISILALLFVAFVVLGVYATTKAVRAAKRGVERTVTQARRTVEDTTLRAKSFGQTGVAGDLAQLRLSLRTSMRATQDALQAGAAEDASLSESLALFERLSAHGHELDDEMKRLEREPDRATVAARLPDLRERAERITHSAESLRWAARDRAQRFADGDLEALSSEIDMEAGALRHWTSAEGAADPSSDTETQSWTAASGRNWSDPAAAADAPGPQTQAAPGAGAQGEDAQPQAITARDPRQETVYPWQKTTRPETTN